jgi:hypothetical protein
MECESLAGGCTEVAMEEHKRGHGPGGAPAPLASTASPRAVRHALQLPHGVAGPAAVDISSAETMSDSLGPLVWQEMQWLVSRDTTRIKARRQQTCGWLRDCSRRH